MGALTALNKRWFIMADSQAYLSKELLNIETFHCEGLFGVNVDLMYCWALFDWFSIAQYGLSKS